MDADIPALGAIYSILLIIIGQFFLINLIFAAIFYTFMK